MNDRISNAPRTGSRTRLNFAPAADPKPADSVLSYIHMLSSRLDRAFYSRVEAKYDVTLAEWRIVLTLKHAPATSAIWITNRWGMEKMAVSRAIRRLEQMGRIRRSRNPDDRRSRVLSLTAKGEKLYERIMPGASQRYMEILSCLGNDEIEALRKTLTKLVDHTATLR